MPQSFDYPEEIRHGSEPDLPLAEGSTRHDLRFEFVLTKKQSLADTDLPPRAYQALPFVWFLRYLTSEQHLDPALQEVSRCGILRTHGLCTGPPSVAEEARRKHARVVKHHQVSRVEQVG